MWQSQSYERCLQTTPVRFLQEALAEAAEAELGYAEHSDAAASRFLARLERFVYLVGRVPSLGQSWESRPGIRRFPLRGLPYVVFYRVGDSIDILAVAHTSRKPGYWRSRLDSSDPGADLPRSGS
jgi:plasmid stabilization system protein ParE